MLHNEQEAPALAEACVLLESWRMEYNQERPHSSLGYLTPQEFAQAASKFELLPASGLLPPKLAKINPTSFYPIKQPAELHL